MGNGIFLPGGKTAEFKNDWRYTSMRPYGFIACTGTISPQLLLPR